MVVIKGEDLNGLGQIIKMMMIENIKNEKGRMLAQNEKGSLVVTDPNSDVSATIIFNNGEIIIQNGSISRPTASVAAGFEELAEMSSGKLITMAKCLITGKVKAKGNLFKLLRMSKSVFPPS